MKTFNSIIKTLPLFLLVGMLLFSCSFNGNDSYGTLVLNLPGSDPARAISREFINTLHYNVVCDGGGDKEEVSQKFRSGESASILLSPGNWNVTVTVLNAADEDISRGGSKVSVNIEAGKTASVTIPISIDTSGNKITSFSITGSINSERSEIKNGNGYDDSRITVYVKPNETGEINKNETVKIEYIHTGVSAAPLSGSSLSIASLENSDITVTAENGYIRTYTVTVEEILQVSLTIDGLPSNVKIEGALVFAPDTINSTLDFINAITTGRSNILATGISQNAKDIYLIDPNYSNSIDDDNFVLRDYMRWMRSGRFDVVINDESEYRKAQVTFSNGIGIAQWDSFTIIKFPWP